MIQIVIWMLCVYLMIKGVELRLIAASSTHETRGKSMAVALVWMVVAFVAAGVFFWLSIVQGAQMPQAPSYNPYGY